MPPKGKATTHFSSAKAAEALAARGGGGFGGFSGSTPTGSGFAFGSKYVGQVVAAVPSAAAAAGGDAGGARAAAAAIIPADLDGELAQQLQKLSKRDATTKLKALQALRALAKDKPVEDLQAALPSWAYLFGRLVMDGNRAVRAEACHVTAALAAAVGRGIAPLLKSLLPPLWLAQFDAYGEAAAAARGAFAAAFPAPAKQREALLFCRAEVLQLLSDNLSSTPQSLGDAKKESVEELADRHERVLAATCGALAALLDLAAPAGTAQSAPAAGAAAAAEPSAAEQEVLAGIQAQLELPAFYKAVLQSKAAPVRRAAYGLVAAAAERRPQLLSGSLAVSAAAVLGSLGDKEPSNHEAMWGMLLAYARAAFDSWRHINMQNAFLPRLWAFLRHGCHGSTAASYPALLPLVSLLPPDVLGPHPAFFCSLLESIWQGIPALAGPGGGPPARQAAAAAFQDCLLYALLKSDQLAAAGGTEAAGGEAAGGTEAAGGEAAGGSTTAQQDYCAELLQASVGQLLMPALTSAAAAPEAAAAAEAQAVLAGAVGRLSTPSASASSRERLEQLLQVVGASLSAAMQQALSSASAVEQQPEGGSAGAAPGASSSELCERAAPLVAALQQAAGTAGHASLGAAVAQPLIALLLPEVRSGSAPPAASSLLAALLKSFPQHAAADAARPESPSTAAAAAAAAAAPADEMAALRLHQSASFTIESIVRRLVEEQQPEAAAANCDLLLSCLPQVHHPARKLAEVLQQLLPQQQGGAASPAALLLLQRLVSGQHAELAITACRSAELDKATTALASNGSWLAGSDEVTPQVLALLLVGDGSASLLSEAAQAALLGQLVQQLQAAGEAAAAAGSSTAEAAPAAAPVMQVVQRSVLSPALDASSSSEVCSLRLHLLAAALGLLLRDTAADAQEAAAAAEAAAAMDASDRDPSTFLDESDVESVEVPQQLGVAAAAARQLWQQAAALGQLVQRAPAEQQAVFAASLQQEVLRTLEQHAAPAAAAAAADVAAQLLLPALEGTSVVQQLLQGLLKQQPDEAAAGGSSAAAAAGLEAPLALLLAATAAAAGFEALLPPSSPQGAAHSAVAILAALQPVSSTAGREPSQQLRQHIAVSAAATLLQPALGIAAAAAATSGSHAAVLAALLLQAVASGSGGAVRAAASWFAGAAAEQQLSTELLLQLLPTVAPAFRSSTDLLQQSRLAELSQRLCQQCCAAEPAALASRDGQRSALQLLQAAVACFPCITGADVAAQLPSPAAAAAAGQQQGHAVAAAAEGSSSSFSKGDAVWYRQQDGSWAEAEVAVVDLTIQPPSYSIRFSATPVAALRETEASRLQPRQLGQPAPPSAAEQAASAAAVAAAAAERRAAAGAALAPVGCCTPEEQAALLQVLQHEVRGTRAAAAAARAEGSAADASPAVAAAVATLLHSCMAYCNQQLNQQQWTLILEQLRTTLAACAASLAAAAARVAAAVCVAAGEVAVGADMSSPAVALQFFRRLKLKGVLERSAKARAEAGRVAATLAAQLAALDQELLPQLLPALQAYTRAAAMASSSRSVAERDWQAAEAAVCGDALQLFVTAGSMAAAAGVCGDEAAAVLSDWMAGPLGAAQHAPGFEESAAMWQLLSQHVATTLRGADRAFLLAAVDRANAGMDATGVDALGSLLALSLSGIPPASMAGAAFAAILQHPELTAALTAAEGVDEEALEEQQQAGGSAASDGGDAAAALEQVGVRPELAAAVAGSPGSSGFYTGWALLMAHVLAAPADSHGRRLLAQSVKEAHALVPALMDALLPLLPLDTGGSSRRRDSSGSAVGGGTPASAAAAAATGGSSSSSSSAAAAFASQLAELGPYPSGHSDDLAALSPAQQQHAQRFAVLLYAAVLQALPASARLWFADLRDRGTAAATERYTSGAVSGQLLAAELAAVTEAASAFGKFDKFSVRANATSREVIAVMEVEDGHMLELAVKLPAALPLRPPELECRRKVGVTEGRLRKWLLSISAFLRTQNGSVAEAISLWKRNVDKEFEGQEECLICYSIIQPTSGQLPRLGCRTCRKRFHGGCLYKWFKSSGKSNCPHCQSPW